jgi:hypothetical protein
MLENPLTDVAREEERVSSIRTRAGRVDTYRTMCLAPKPDFQRVLEQIREIQVAA